MASPIPIYIITLKRTPERKIFIQRQLDALKLSYQFVEGIDKYDLESAEFRSKIAKSLDIDESNMEYKFTKLIHTLSDSKIYNDEGLGRLACLLSHLKAYNLILENNDDIACVLEDDAVLLPTFPTVLAAYSKLSCDILMLSTQSRTIRKALEKKNPFYKCIMKSHNYAVLVKQYNKKSRDLYKHIIELLGFSPHLYPNQSKAVTKILDEFISKYKDMLELHNPQKHLLWLLSSSTLKQIQDYRKLKEYTACKLGGLPVRHSHQPLGEYHCIAEPAEQNSSAMGYLLNRSFAGKWKQMAIAKNILVADIIPWHLYDNHEIDLRFISPPCVTASYIYLKHSAHYR